MVGRSKNEFQRNAFEGLYESRYANLRIDSELQYNNFISYLKLGSYIDTLECKEILEIGAGYSTIILADIVNRTGGSVTSIDANFELYANRAGGTPFEQQIDEHVETIKGVSINPEELRSVYGTSHDTIGGVDSSKVLDNLGVVTSIQGRPVEKIRSIELAMDTDKSFVKNTMADGDRINIPEALADIYVSESTLKEHISKLQRSERVDVISELQKENRMWDAIWFDSGEVSSLLEWIILKESIKPGGLAAFHDVLFPKSMKNFVVVASVMADPNWEILLFDDSTKQGLVIARRLT